MILSRLPVGHTHEDVDQKFSVTARVGPCFRWKRECAASLLIGFWPTNQRLRASDIVSPEEFAQAVKGAFLDISRDGETNVSASAYDKSLHSSPPQGLRSSAFLSTVLQIYCCLETVWITWDFEKWLSKGPGVFPNPVEHTYKRGDTCHQTRFNRSFTYRDKPTSDG